MTGTWFLRLGPCLRGLHRPLSGAPQHAPVRRHQVGSEVGVTTLEIGDTGGRACFRSEVEFRKLRLQSRSSLAGVPGPYTRVLSFKFVKPLQQPPYLCIQWHLHLPPLCQKRHARVETKPTGVGHMCMMAGQSLPSGPPQTRHLSLAR